MKMFIRVFAVIAVVFIIIGLFITGIVSVVSGGDIYNRIMDTNSVSEEGQRTVEMNMADFGRIKIDIKNADVTLKTVEGDTASIVYDVFKNDKIEELKGADFGLFEENTFFSFFNFSSWFGIKERNVIISIPSSALPELKLNVVNGDISGEGIKVSEIEVSVVNANINFSKTAVDGDLSATTVNGKINLNEITAKNIIKCKTVNGRIENEMLDVVKVDLSTVNGKITAQKLKARDVNLDTVNGTLDISVFGIMDDYNIKFKSANGDFNLNGERYEKKATINTSKDKSISFNSVNGDGYLAFVNE